jgi:hypothetical protein
MGYMLKPCIGIPSPGPPYPSSQHLQAGNNSVLALFSSPLELVCNHLINPGSLSSCLRFCWPLLRQIPADIYRVIHGSGTVFKEILWEIIWNRKCKYVFLQIRQSFQLDVGFIIVIGDT